MARTVMEAMAAGLVVIGSEVGGQKEILCNEVNSLTFQPEDAYGLAKQIQRVIQDPIIESIWHKTVGKQYWSDLH